MGSSKTLWERSSPNPGLTGKKENFLFQVNKLYLLESEKNYFEFLYPENPHPTPIGACPETPTTTIRDFLKGLGSFDTNHSQKMNRTKLPVPYPFLFLSTALCVYNHDPFFPVFRVPLEGFAARGSN